MTYWIWECFGTFYKFWQSKKLCNLHILFEPIVKSKFKNAKRLEPYICTNVTTKYAFAIFGIKKPSWKKKNVHHFLLTHYIGKCFDTWMQYYYVCSLKMMLKIKYRIIKICTKVKTHYTPKYCSHININSTFGFFGYMWTPHLGLFLFISSILH